MRKKKSLNVNRKLNWFFRLQTRMNVGVAHSEVNPNTRVMNSRGIWLTYALGVGILHIVLLSIPFFSVPVVWTLTNVIHNFVSHNHRTSSSIQDKTNAEHNRIYSRLRLLSFLCNLRKI